MYCNLDSHGTKFHAPSLPLLALKLLSYTCSHVICIFIVVLVTTCAAQGNQGDDGYNIVLLANNYYVY